MSIAPKTALEYFNSAAANYEKTAAGCTRDLAKYIVERFPVEGEPVVLLDNACGTGIVAQEVYFRAIALGKEPPQTFCADGAETLVDIGRGVLNDLPNVSVQFAIAPGENLPFESDKFTHSITNCGLMFFTDAVKGAQEIYRTLKPGGTAIATTWKVLGYLKVIHQAQKAVRPDGPLFNIPLPPAWFRAEKLVETMTQGGFSDVKIYEHEAHYGAKSADELMAVILSTFGQAIADWSEDEKAKFGVELHKAVKSEAKTFRRAGKTPLDSSTDYVGLPMTALIAVATK